jgi:hypothetical protein
MEDRRKMRSCGNNVEEGWRTREKKRRQQGTRNR